MSLIIPLPTNVFWDVLPLAQGSTFEPGEAMNVNRTGGGQVLASTAGERLWGGQVTFGLTDAADRRQAQAVLNAVRRPGHPFLCYDRKRPYPLADLGGVRLIGTGKAQGPQYNARILDAPDDDLSTLSLQGLPPNYVLTAGDLIGYTFGATPKRYYLHELAIGAVASSAGSTGPIQITPFRSHGVAAGTPVSLVMPLMTAKYDPDTFSAGTGRAGGIEAGRAFGFIQTLEY